MTGPFAETRSLSDLLGALDLRAQGWCYSDIGAASGFSIPPSDAVLFHAVLHGTLRLTCASGGTREVKPGDVIMVLSGEAHALRMTAQSPVAAHEYLKADRASDIPPSVAIGHSGPVAARVLSGRLAPRWPAEISRAALPATLQIGGEGNPAAKLLREETLLLAGMGSGSSALLTRLAGLMLVAALRADPACRQMLSPSKQDPISQSMALIAANPAATWSVAKLAHSVGMGRSNFAAHFTAEIGRAPMDVVASARMELAARLLGQGRLKIAEISEMAGYGSEAAFSRRFTRHFGLTPSQMRSTDSSDDGAASQPVWQSLLPSKMTEGTAALMRQRAVRQGTGSPAPADPKLSLLAGGRPR